MPKVGEGQSQETNRIFFAYPEDRGQRWEGGEDARYASSPLLCKSNFICRFASSGIHLEYQATRRLGFPLEAEETQPQG